MKLFAEALNTGGYNDGVVGLSSPSLLALAIFPEANADLNRGSSPSKNHLALPVILTDWLCAFKPVLKVLTDQSTQK